MQGRGRQPRRIITGLLGVLLLVVTIVPTGVVSAQEASEGITMSPVNKHYELRPGDTKSDTLLVINHGSTDYDFTVYASAYDVEAETYSAVTGDISNPMADVGEWVSFETTSYHLKSGDNVTIPFTVTVPKKVASGAHTGVIYAKIKPGSSNGLIITKSVGLALYANVGASDVRQEGRVESIVVPKYIANPPIIVSARYVNTGGSYYVATAQMAVYDLFGTKLGEQSKEFTVLPDRPRKIELSVDKLNFVGIYKVDGSTRVLGQDTPFSGYVVIVPTWLIVAVIMAVALLVIFIRYRKEHHRVHFKR